MAVKILFVCLGNICRSPTAHAVFRQHALQAKLAVSIESAGTSASHKGAAPDSRSIQAAAASGYDFKGIYSKPVKDSDFAYYDMILAMDNQNLTDLQQRCPPEHQHKLQLFMQYHPDYPRYREVPDPYYGGSRGFAQVLLLIEQGAKSLLQYLKQKSA